LPIFLYRYTVSPILGPRCRFLPTCSDYALEALAEHGLLRGAALILRRLLRCHPWGGSGFDPVPPRRAGLVRSLSSRPLRNQTPARLPARPRSLGPL
jgi:uncharacterized protein